MADGIKTENEWAVMQGRNLDNHSASLRGFPEFVRIGHAETCILRDRQSVYRLCAWLLRQSNLLPNEDGSDPNNEDSTGATFEEVLAAVRSC